MNAAPAASAGQPSGDGQPQQPEAVSNPPGQDTIAYRVGDFAGFREALLRPLPDEEELTGYTPAAGDLGLQVLEWCAYLADVLTFYNERIATESYLRTATRPESLGRLVRVLGYRPRPGIGATGVLAARHRPGHPREALVIPAGTPITSTPTPGIPVQTFETTEPASFTGPCDVPVTLLPAAGMTPGSVLLAGTVTGVRPGDRLLLVPRGWSGTDDAWALVTTLSATAAADPSGRKNTQVSYNVIAGTDPGSMATPPDATGYRLLRPVLSTPIFGALTTSSSANTSGDFFGFLQQIKTDLSNQAFDLGATVRAISVGDIILLDGGGAAAYPAVVTEYAETTWYYVNGALQTTFPSLSTTPTPVVVPAPHSVLTVAMPATAADNLSAVWQQWYGWFQQNGNAGAAPGDNLPQAAGYGFRDVGTLVPVPAASLSRLPSTVTVPAGFGVPAGGARAFVEDAAGNGAEVTVTAGAAGQVTLGAPAGTPVTLSPALLPPLRLFTGLIDVSRGATVAAETLGSGDATIAGQTFTLAKSPLTYLAAGPGQASTLTVRVGGVAWTEVDTFFRQPADAPVFVTRERDDGTTQVRFGDGVNGARLPDGAGNVVASYRYGSGQASPPAGRLTGIARPAALLAGVRNPVPVAGGADPDPPSALRANAPASTLTFGRAISAADYETIAARTPGVDRARAVWTWDAGQQRSVVTVYVGDSSAAPALARAALAAADDPNRPLTITAAAPFNVLLAGTLAVAADRQPADVAAAVQAALLDSDTGFFSTSRMKIGQPLYRSQLEAALMAGGVLAITGLAVEVIPGSLPPGALPLIRPLSGWLSPGVGGFFRLLPQDLAIAAVTASG